MMSFCLEELRLPNGFYYKLRPFQGAAKNDPKIKDESKCIGGRSVGLPGSESHLAFVGCLGM